MTKETRQQRRAAARGYNPIVGFTPTPNARIDNAISSLTSAYQLTGMSGPDAQQRAVNEVARSLPMPRMGMFNPAAPTRNNDASYRTGGSITGDSSRAAARLAALTAKPKPVRKPRATKKKVAAA